MDENEIDLIRLEQDERWLKEVLEPAREIGTAAIKHRVRIAVQEEWLRVQLAAADCGNSIARSRKAVRTAIEETAAESKPQPVTHEQGRTRTPIRLSTWLRIGLAAAAVVALALIVPRFMGSNAGENSIEGVSAHADRIATAARDMTGVDDPNDAASNTTDLTAWTRTAGESAPDELDREIESLRGEFDTATQTIVEGWSADLAGWDDLLEEDTAEGS